jgi:hypothetical protein
MLEKETEDSNQSEITKFIDKSIKEEREKIKEKRGKIRSTLLFRNLAQGKGTENADFSSIPAPMSLSLLEKSLEEKEAKARKLRVQQVTEVCDDVDQLNYSHVTTLQQRFADTSRQSKDYKYNSKIL